MNPIGLRALIPRRAICSRAGVGRRSPIVALQVLEGRAKTNLVGNDPDRLQGPTVRHGVIGDGIHIRADFAPPGQIHDGLGGRRPMEPDFPGQAAKVPVGSIIVFALRITDITVYLRGAGQLPCAGKAPVALLPVAERTVLFVPPRILPFLIAQAEYDTVAGRGTVSQVQVRLAHVVFIIRPQAIPIPVANTGATDAHRPIRVKPVVDAAVEARQPSHDAIMPLLLPIAKILEPDERLVIAVTERPVPVVSQSPVPEEAGIGRGVVQFRVRLIQGATHGKPGMNELPSILFVEGGPRPGGGNPLALRIVFRAVNVAVP